jgi:hypothetical protein
MEPHRRHPDMDSAKTCLEVGFVASISQRRRSTSRPRSYQGRCGRGWVASIWRTWGAAAQATTGSAAVVTAAGGRGASPKVRTLHPLLLLMLPMAASRLALGSCCEFDPLHGLGSCASAAAAMKKWWRPPDSAAEIQEVGSSLRCAGPVPPVPLWCCVAVVGAGKVFCCNLNLQSPSKPAGGELLF